MNQNSIFFNTRADSINKVIRDKSSWLAQSIEGYTGWSNFRQATISYVIAASFAFIAIAMSIMIFGISTAAPIMIINLFTLGICKTLYDANCQTEDNWLKYANSPEQLSKGEVERNSWYTQKGRIILIFCLAAKLMLAILGGYLFSGLAGDAHVAMQVGIIFLTFSGVIFMGLLGYLPDANEVDFGKLLLGEE